MLVLPRGTCRTLSNYGCHTPLGFKASSPPTMSPGRISYPIDPHPLWGPKCFWLCGGGATPSCPAPQKPRGRQVLTAPSCSSPLLPQCSICPASLGADFWEVSANCNRLNWGRILLRAGGRTHRQGLVPKARAPPRPQKAPSSRVCRHTHTAASAWRCHTGDRHDS